MKKVLFLLPLLVAVLFLGACESEMLMDPEVYVTPTTVDVAAEPFKGLAPLHAHLHADVRNSIGHTIEWYVINGIYLGAGEDLWHTFNEIQDYFIECRILVDGEVVATDTCKVSVTALLY